jgi:hypothetical protein
MVSSDLLPDGFHDHPKKPARWDQVTPPGDVVYSPTPIASTGRDRSARRVAAERANRASREEVPSMAASGRPGP